MNADKGEKGASGEMGDENLDKLIEELEFQLNQNAAQLNLQGNQLVYLKSTVNAQGYVMDLQKNQILQQEKIHVLYYHLHVILLLDDL